MYKNFIILFALAISLIALNSSAKNCPEIFSKYGDNKTYQDAFCKIFVSAEKKESSSYRNLTFNDEGSIQIFSNFPGSTISTSTGARVYYLLPFRNEKKVTPLENGTLEVIHPSGVKFNFDRKGNLSSPDLKMKVATDINSTNKGGVEIDNYPQGLVLDFGYRAGNSPILKKNTVVTITDKNYKKCTVLNSDLNKIEKDEVELIYKTNESFHGFLTKHCPNLDLSDFFKPMSEGLSAITKPSFLSRTPALEYKNAEKDSTRVLKPQYDTIEDLIQELDSKEGKSVHK
jgi:hypothetical protein